MQWIPTFGSSTRDRVRTARGLQRRGAATAVVLWSGLVTASCQQATSERPPNDATRTAPGATHAALVSEFASFNTPGVVDGRVEAIAVDGDTVFVGGTFTQVREPLDGEIVDQPYLFAYSKSSGNLLRDFDPLLNDEVLALETTGEGTGVFVGGAFNRLNGEGNSRGLVKIDDDGDRSPGFVARPDARINTLRRRGDTLYVGGSFTRIGRTTIENLAALDTLTGTVSARLDLDFDGTISTFGDSGTVRTNGVQGVDEIDITSDGRLLVVVGNFLSIDAVSRSRLALIELDGQARVSAWNTDVFDVQCPADRFPQYVKGMDIAPDDTYFVTGSTGFRRPGQPACDTVVRFELDDLTDGDVRPTWVNYAGGDSVFEVVATGHAVYAGGHFRWLNNDTTSDGRSAGPGSVPRSGLAALDPVNGLTLLDWRADRNPRGIGVFAMVAEDEGLYIGDDTDFLNGSEHAKLKFLPITSNTVDRPELPSLPATLLGTRNDALDGSPFDGTTLGAPVPVLDAGWLDTRGAMFVGGQLFHADSQGRMWSSRFTGGAFEPASQVDLLGLTGDEWRLSELGGLFFDHDRGRVYYTLQGDARLFWRAFTPGDPNSPHFGNEEHVAEQPGDILWGDVTGMDVIGDHLYFSRGDGALYRAAVDGTTVVVGTTRAIGGPSVDGRLHDGTLLAFMGESAPLGEPDDSPVDVEAPIPPMPDGPAL